MKSQAWFLSLSMLAALAGATPLLAQAAQTPAVRSYSIAAPDPASHVRELARMLRGNDLNGLVSAMVPPAEYRKLHQEYESERSRPLEADQRQKFDEGIQRLLAVDGVDSLMAEIEPRLAQARPKANGAIMMGLGALQMAVAANEELDAEQRANLQALLPGIQRWVSSTDFLSSASMRQVLELLADATRKTGIRNMDQLRQLSFDQVMVRAGTLFAASKQALRIYGLDLDGIVDSLQVQVLALEGDTARVRTTVTVFDAPLSTEMELVLVDGRWYSKDSQQSWAFKRAALGS